MASFNHSSADTSSSFSRLYHDSQSCCAHSNSISTPQPLPSPSPPPQPQPSPSGIILASYDTTIPLSPSLTFLSFNAAVFSEISSYLNLILFPSPFSFSGPVHSPFPSRALLRPVPRHPLPPHSPRDFPGMLIFLRPRRPSAGPAPCLAYLPGRGAVAVVACAGVGLGFRSMLSSGCPG